MQADAKVTGSAEPVNDIIGESLPRLEGSEKITGRAQYTDDLKLPGMLYGAILGSEYPHARIASIDTAQALALPGVKAVITGESIAMNRCGGAIKDETPLADGKVRYIGQPVAAVAAVDVQTAREATRLIDIEYEELDAVFDAESAIAEDAPNIHEDKADYFALYEIPPEKNVVAVTRFQEGDPDSAWDDCDVIVEGVYETPAQEHMYMEPCSTVASCDINGKITIWSSMQSVFRVQAMTAEALAMPMSKLRVIAPRIGGGFGGKGELTYQPIAAALSRECLAPVKVTLTREEDMSITKSRHPAKIFIRTGAKSDGTLHARECRILFDTGAYADEGPLVNAIGVFFAAGPYNIEHVIAEAKCIYTNKHKASAFRGFGNPQITYASESQIDEIAGKLGMDPIDIRLKNAIQTGDQWFGGQGVETGSLTACLEAVREASKWDERKASNKNRPGKKRGIVFAAAGHICGLLGGGATTRLNEDGTITVNTGAVDVGAGEDTVLAQIAAATLGVSIDQVNYATADTDVSPYNWNTAASRTTFIVGKAVRESAERVREQIFKHASEMFECSEGDLELRDGGLVGIKGVPDAVLPFVAIAGRALYATGGPISGSHNWIYSAEPHDPKRSIISGFTLDGMGVFVFAAQVIEVEVDEATGKVDVAEVWSAHDVGRALNPGAVDGQIHGAVVQGLGYALCEELVWEDGQLLNPSMMDYKIPSILDVPYAINPVVLEYPDEQGPFGAKGIGEIGLVPVAPAVANAVQDAIGKRIRRIPLTGEYVLEAILESERP